MIVIVPCVRYNLVYIKPYKKSCFCLGKLYRVNMDITLRIPINQNQISLKWKDTDFLQVYIFAPTEPTAPVLLLKEVSQVSIHPLNHSLQQRERSYSKQYCRAATNKKQSSTVVLRSVSNTSTVASTKIQFTCKLQLGFQSQGRISLSYLVSPSMRALRPKPALQENLRL